MKIKKLFKSLTFLLVFGIMTTFLVGITLKVNAVDSKYIEIVSGTGTELGDEVRIGDEHFYILSNNGEEIKMLAKYNVDISAMCTYNYQSKDTKPDGTSNVGYNPMCGVRTNYTSLQDSSISGVPDATTGDIIGVPFSTELKHGTNLLAYKGSVIETYVNEYVTALNKKYNTNVVGDLLDVQTFNKLFNKVDLATAPASIKRIVNVTSWTKVPTNSNQIMILDAKDGRYYSFENDKFFSVRPLIIAPASALNKKEVEKSCNGDFCFADNDEDGKVSLSDEICIREECFYVLSNENNAVKMLAKYNLDTGLNCVTSSHTGTFTSSLNSLACEDITGTQLRQNINARGFITYPGLTMVSYGGVNYNASDINSKLDEYVSYLNSLANANYTATLITIDEIEHASGRDFEEYVIKPSASPKSSLNSNIGNLTGIGEKYYYLFQIKDVPDWMYSNSYWTNTSSGTDAMYAVTSTGLVSDFTYATSGEFGIRPLITVSLEDVPTSNKDDVDKACYICGDEYVWTNDPDESSCTLNEEITDANSCVNNPKMGIDRHTIVVMIIISIALIALTIFGKQNRFKRI